MSECVCERERVSVCVCVNEWLHERVRMSVWMRRYMCEMSVCMCACIYACQCVSSAIPTLPSAGRTNSKVSANAIAKHQSQLANGRVPSNQSLIAIEISTNQIRCCASIHTYIHTYYILHTYIHVRHTYV